MEVKICKCKVCGKDFECTHRRKYCDDECRQKARRSQRKIYKVPKVIKECEWCGKEFESSNDYRIKFCSTDCQQTSYSRVVREHGSLEKHLEERRTNKEKRLKQLRIEAKERQKQRALANLAKLLNKEVLRRERVAELTRPCVECGTPFYNIHPSALTCTPLCSKRRKNRISRMYDSKRLNETNIVDKDITVQKLFKKYGGICYLCGKECDFNDKVITEEGYMIVGKTYPSVEHIIPISKGGLHSWDNVNLAHHYCNTLKRDKNIF